MKNLLKDYLSQYYRANRKKAQLENRLSEFREKMTGTKAIRYSDMPAAHTNVVKSDTEEDIVRVQEIEEKIKAQITVCLDAMERVATVLAFLPDQSAERCVLEYRHIDCHNWQRITEEINYSRSACHYIYNEGLRLLLEDERVVEILAKFDAEKSRTETDL